MPDAYDAYHARHSYNKRYTARHSKSTGMAARQ